MFLARTPEEAAAAVSACQAAGWNAMVRLSAAPPAGEGIAGWAPAPLTVPYNHDGSASTLEEVIDAYDRGGRLTEDGDNARDGATNPWPEEAAALRGSTSR